MRDIAVPPMAVIAVTTVNIGESIPDVKGLFLRTPRIIMLYYHGRGARLPPDLAETESNELWVIDFKT